MKYIRFNQIITALCCLLLISCGIDKNLKKGEKFLSQIGRADVCSSDLANTTMLPTNSSKPTPRHLPKSVKTVAS